MADDLFDGILNLEDESYEEGYQLGVADGSQAGRIEGRIFGLEKGFEKFIEIGRIHGRACVWGARLSTDKGSVPQSSELIDLQSMLTDAEKMPQEEDSSRINPDAPVTMENLPSNRRLEKHIRTLFALVEPESMSTQNTEDAVSDFDDRYKRALSKVKVIENIIGEHPIGEKEKISDKKPSQTGISVRLTKAEPGEKNIEDFGIRFSRA
jgi:Essential protein Yae1, N terminal